MWMQRVSLVCATTYSLRQSLQLNPGFSDIASLSNQLTLGPHLHCISFTMTGGLLHGSGVSVGSVDPSSGPHTQAINTLTTGQSPSPHTLTL